MRRLLGLVPVASLVLLAAGCSQAPAGSEGQSVSADELNKKQAASAAEGGVAPPSPPSDSAPGVGGKGKR